MNFPLEPETILQDRYLIVETIEQAERYRVYVAEDQQTGGENCILREFVASEVNEAVRIHAQFMPIIHQLQSLRHPQLEKFKDFLIQEKNLYLIQSYFEGQDYQTRLSGDSPLTEDEAIQLLRQALPTLSYLHSQFVIHGDISPSHLLLRSPDGALIFTHFGLLQEIAAQMGIETAETKLLNRVEQLSVIPSGAAQDLYALAVTALMLLTGKEPQDLFNRQTQSWDWENYRLLSDRLTDVINRMLSVNPTASPPTADAILALLESVKIPPPTPPTPPTLPLNLPNTPQLIPTEATSFPVSNTSFLPEPSKDLSKSIITGSIILGIFVLAGLALARYLPSFSTLQPQPTQTPEPTSNLPQVPQSTPVSPAFPPPISSISPPSPTPFSPPPLQPSTSNNTNATIVGQPGKKNIRRGPGLEYAPRHIAYPGDRVQVIESTRNSDNFIWHHIYFPQSGADGWIAGNLLAVDGQTQPQIQPQLQPQQPPPKASSSGTNAIVSGTPGTKNIRSGAGTAYGVVGTVRTGERVQILGSSYDRGGYQWYKVYHPQSGTTGWIAAQLINSD